MNCLIFLASLPDLYHPRYHTRVLDINLAKTCISFDWRYRTSPSVTQPSASDIQNVLLSARLDLNDLRETQEIQVLLVSHMVNIRNRNLLRH